MRSDFISCLQRVVVLRCSHSELDSLDALPHAVDEIRITDSEVIK